MKILKRRRKGSSDDLPDIETLVSVAILEREQRRAAADGTPAPMGDGPAPANSASALLEPTDDHRARAQALLYDFAMRSFSAQVENIRRDAVITHLQDRAQHGLRFRRLLSISILGTLISYGLVRLAGWAMDRWGLSFEQIIDLATRQALMLRDWAGI